MREFELTTDGRRLVIGGKESSHWAIRAELARLIHQAAQRDFHVRRALASWYTFFGGPVASMGPSDDENRLVDRLVSEIEAGTMRVQELPPSPVPTYSHRFPSRTSAGESETEFDGNVIEDDARLLEITRCDPQFDHNGLEFTFAIRGLEGQVTRLRIVSEAFPGKVVHERELEPHETTDGLHPTAWDGIVSAGGDYEGELLPPQFSPACVEIIHDDAYRDEAPFTIAGVVHVVEIEDVVFATRRAIFLPDGGAEQPSSDTARLTGLDAVAAVLRYAAFHEDAILAIFGHTDTVGSESSNLELSEERATNVLHVVTGDADAWAAHCNEHFEIADFQRVLAWIARSRGWDTDPGKVDGVFGPITRTARANFRDQMNAEYDTGLEQGTKQGVADWKAYFTLYDEELARLLEWSLEDLQRVRGQLRLADPAAVGCGEAFPAHAPAQNNLASAANRRVDFVFFDPDEFPELPGEPPGQELYGTGAYRAQYLPVGPSTLTVPLKIRLTRKQEPLVGENYVIEQAGQVIVEGRTNGDGHVIADVPKGAQNLSLRVPTFGAVYALELGELRPLGTLAGVQDRLTNLGYHCSRGGFMDGQTTEALKAFQFAQGLDVTGEVDDDTIARLRAEHRS